MDHNQENIPQEPTQLHATRRETTHPFNSKNLTSIKGRMGRLDFAILSIGLSLLVLLIHKVSGINPLIVVFSFSTEEKIIASNLINTSAYISLIGFLGYILLSIKRFHDINYSGWLALIFVAAALPLGLLAGLLKFVGFIIRIILLFAKGEPHVNRFGPIPDGNHRNKLLLLIGILIVMFLIYSNFYSEAKPIIKPIAEQMLIEIQQQ